MAQDAGGDVLLGRRQRRERVVDMRVDDPLGTAQRHERVQAHRRGARALLVLPQSLHDELQVRSLDADLVS